MNAARAGRRAGVLLTALADGVERFVEAGKRRRAIRWPRRFDAALRAGKSATVEHDGVRYFLTVQVPPVRLVMIGAVHISQALAPIARVAGLDGGGDRPAHGVCDAGAVLPIRL